jgi:hypothetical protein
MDAEGELAGLREALAGVPLVAGELVQLVKTTSARRVRRRML